MLVSMPGALAWSVQSRGRPVKAGGATRVPRPEMAPDRAPLGFSLIGHYAFCFNPSSTASGVIGMCRTRTPIAL
jgi:hypothetical protein